MDERRVLEAVAEVGEGFAGERRDRQRRTEFDRADSDALPDAGYLLTCVPVEAGGLWAGPARSTRLVASLLRSIARGDSSVALVAAMHPAVLSYWPAPPEPLMDVVRGKTAVSGLAESILTRLSRVIGGGTFTRSSPFGAWFEDVRALGFLRPPWGLAYDQMIAGA